MSTLRTLLTCSLFSLCLWTQAQDDPWSKSEMYLDNGRYEEARRCLVDYISLNRDNNEGLAAATNNMGEIMLELGQIQTARRYYYRSYDLYSQLAKDRPDEFIYFVARCQHNLGSLHYQLENYKLAQKYLTLALHQREKLFALSPADFGADLAQTLNILAALCCLQDKYPEAEKYYSRALDRLKTIESPNLDTRMEWAMTYNNFAILYRKMEQLDLAENYYIKATELYEQVYKRNPLQAREDYKAVLTNMANLYMQMHSPSKADKCTKKSKKL